MDWMWQVRGREMSCDPQVTGFSHWWVELPCPDMGILKKEKDWGRGRESQWAGGRERGQELGFCHVKVDVPVEM